MEMDPKLIAAIWNVIHQESIKHQQAKRGL